jgi:O-antigen/teichoic acid export membrane protein
LFVSQVLVANLIAPKAFGSYTLALSIVTSSALIAQLGLPHTLLRRAAAALSRDDAAEARHEIISALAVAVGAALVCGAILGSPLGKELFQFAFARTAVATVTALVGIKAGLRVLENVLPEALRAFRDYSGATIYGQLLTNFLLCLVLAVLLATSTDANLEDVLLVGVIVSAVALVPAAFAVATKLRATGGVGLSFRQPVEPSLWLSTVGLALVGQLDLLVVGALGNARDLALYSAPFRLALLIGLPLVAVNQAVAPLIAGWHAQAMRNRIQQTLQATAGVAVIGAALIGVFYLVAGHWFLRTLFGSSFYADGWTVLVILTVGQILQTYAGSCGYALLMTGNHRAYAVIVSVSVPMTLGLQIAGFEIGGIEGVAVATALMLSLQNFAQMIVVRRRAGFSTRASPRATFSELLAARQRRIDAAN